MDNIQISYEKQKKEIDHHKFFFEFNVPKNKQIITQFNKNPKKII